MPVDVVQIRPARLKDASALAAAYEEAWRNAYQGVIPHLSLERMIARRGLRWWESALRKRTPLLVLDFDGAAAGYVTYGRCRLGRAPFQGKGIPRPRSSSSARARARTRIARGGRSWDARAISS